MTTEPGALLRELSQLEAGARKSRENVWFPLFVFGLINIPGAALAFSVGRSHLGPYFLPSIVLGGILCAVYNARAAEQTGLQPPLLTWLVVLTSANVVAAFCSFVGRTIDSPILNLAGPTGSSVAAYVVLGAWSNSLILTRVAGATAVAMAVSLAVFRGDAAIGVQLILFAAILLAASFYARQEWRRSS